MCATNLISQPSMGIPYSNCEDGISSAYQMLRYTFASSFSHSVVLQIRHTIVFCSLTRHATMHLQGKSWIDHDPLMGKINDYHDAGAGIN